MIGQFQLEATSARLHFRAVRLLVLTSTLSRCDRVLVALRSRLAGGFALVEHASGARSSYCTSRGFFGILRLREVRAKLEGRVGVIARGDA